MKGKAATIGTVVALVVPLAAVVSRIRTSWLNHYGEAAAGAVIVCVGVLVAALGW